MHFVLFCCICVASSVGLKVMFENVDHLSGFDEAHYNLRVRKLNRSTMALNGSIIVKQLADNDLLMSMDLFHSRLGNQQFNHYPMKFAKQGVCDFIDTLHDNYKKYLASFENFPASGECPITPRTVNIRDYVFPSEAMPLVMPRGLWKAVLTTERAGKMIYTLYFLLRVYDE